MGSGRAPPALPWNTSSRPKARSAASTRPSSTPRAVTSPGQARASPPRAPISATSVASPASSRSLATTRAPSSAKRSAVARPMPEAAPVIAATLPASRGTDRSPLPDVGHRLPRLALCERLAALQELDGDAIGRAHERHAPVARRPADRDALVEQALARRVDVVDLVGEMAEVAAAPVGLGIPVVRELDLSLVVARGGQEHQRVAPGGHLVPAQLLEPQLVAVEVERCVEIRDANHGVQVLHAALPGWLASAASRARIYYAPVPRCRALEVPR